jgi:phage shock protein A
MTTHDEVEKALVVLDRLQNVHLAALLRRLRDERDEARAEQARWERLAEQAWEKAVKQGTEDIRRFMSYWEIARNKALDEAAEVAKHYEPNCDACPSGVTNAILALKEPKP